MSTEPPPDANSNPIGIDLHALLPDVEDRPITPPAERYQTIIDIDDTPAISQSASGHEYLYGTLEKKREAVAEDLAYSILELDIPFFENYMLPPLKETINLENDILPTLVTKGHLRADKKSWTRYGMEPMMLGESEDNTYKPLAEIFQATVDAATEKVPGLEQTLVMRLLPDNAPTSEGFRTRPDGILILKGAKASDGNNDKTPYWYDIAAVQEFKKANHRQDRNDNVSKLVYSMQVIMTLDPSRRFTYGITIENAYMRIWFCSRGIVAVSQRIDFTKEVELLVHIYLSLAFASKEELGWDPTVEICNRVGDEPTCRIKVNNETYETTQVLSASAADMIIGRGTRVYKVRHLETANEYVLKDVWIEDDRALEHAIREMILEAVRKTFGEKARMVVATHFLTPIAYCLVHVGGREDHTVDVMMRGKEPPLNNLYDLVIKESSSVDASKSFGTSAASDMEVGKKMKRHLGTPLPRGMRNRQKKYHRRRHYRVVFEEMAEAVSNMTNLSNMFIALRDVAKILYYIHGVKYVHRDISAGNLYFFRGRGLVGDLEYAKLKLDNLTHELRTGTLDFMAVETITRTYLFTKGKFEDNFPMYFKELVGTDTSSEKTANKDPPFFHNDLHDMESVWWIPIWKLFFYRDESQPELDDDKTEERQCNAHLLFPRSLTINERISFIRTAVVYDQMFEWLQPSLVKTKTSLGALRVLLHESYEAFEAAFPNIVSDTNRRSVEKTFEMFYHHCADSAKGIILEPYKTTGLRHVQLDTEDEDQPVEDPLVGSFQRIELGQPTVPGPVPHAPSSGLYPEVSGKPAVLPNSSSSLLSRKRKARDDDAATLIPRPEPRTREFDIEVYHRRP